jgi:CBS domain-containing protein
MNPLLDLTAEELMTCDVILLAEDLPLREATRRLAENRISGAPVVDKAGRCVGVFSTTDLLRFARKPEDKSCAPTPPLPLSCSFQVRLRGPDGEWRTVCTLPPGVCPLQVKQTGPAGELLVCSQPHCVLVDWQLVDVEKLPEDALRQFMTPDPVTVPPTCPVRKLARLMIDAHIHRLIVVDKDRRPQGIVSSTDLLAALARAGDES